MEYSVFSSTLNKHIFDNSKRDLLKKIAEYPDRYIGLFRPNKPRTKILQNLLQSHEIRFGDALEDLFQQYFLALGYRNLEKEIIRSNKRLRLDQLFQDNQYIYFIEQKVRDDHDSSKKDGQMKNFEKKIAALLFDHEESDLKCYTYFIDPSLKKNKNFYNEEIEKIRGEYGIYIKLCYGKELWEEIGHPEVWDELTEYLHRWKEGIPEMPSVNFDENAENSFEEIKKLSVFVFRKLFNNGEVCREILPILFPGNKTLHLLREYFCEQRKTIYANIANKITEIIASIPTRND
ncbi:MAG: restriction endonuclease [Helicobacteraceae bacterium]|jgi:hypothetical protein|nr:restriction endonuclease [Helicobacteraceae bacterium]